MDILSYSDFDEKFGFLANVGDCVNDYTKPQFLVLNDEEPYFISLALSIAKDDILSTLKNFKHDTFTKIELERVLSVVSKLLNILEEF